MLNHALLGLTIVTIYEVLNIVRFYQEIYFNIKLIKQIPRLLNSKSISDIKKEKKIKNISKKLFLSSIKLILILILVIIFIYSINKISNEFINYFISLNGIIELSLITFIYYNLRKYINAKL